MYFCLSYFFKTNFVILSKFLLSLTITKYASLFVTFFKTFLFLFLAASSIPNTAKHPAHFINAQTICCQYISILVSLTRFINKIWIFIIIRKLCTFYTFQIISNCSQFPITIIKYCIFLRNIFSHKTRILYT